MKRFILVLSSLLGFILAQNTTKVATTTGQFLKIAPGARAAGMGESFSAIANDASAIYWNPAGMTRTEGNRLFLSHIQWLAGISYNFFAAGGNIGPHSAVGLMVTNVQVPEDEVRTVLEPEGTGEFFSASDLAIGGGYAHQITDRFSVGATGKLVQEQIWSMSSMAVAFDIGILYQSNWKDLVLGIVLDNYGTKTKLSGRTNLLYVDPDPTIEGNIETIRAELEMGHWNLPLSLKTSLSMKVVDTVPFSLIVAGDMVHPSDNSEYFDFGSELNLFRTFSFRCGYRGVGLNSLEGGLALGAGMNVNLPSGLMITVDYAITDWGRLKNVNQFSFDIGF